MALLDSLVVYWDMESLTSDGKMRDLSGNGNHGNIVGSPTLFSMLHGLGRKFNNPQGGAAVDGIGPFVFAPTIDVTKGLTLHIRIICDDLSAGGVFARVDNSAAALLEPYMAGGSKILRYFDSVVDDSSGMVIVTVTEFDVTTVYTPGARKKGYIDGVKKVDVATTLTGTMNRITVASDAGGTAHQGKVDEVFLFSRDLSDQEVLDVMNYYPPIASGRHAGL